MFSIEKPAIFYSEERSPDNSVPTTHPDEPYSQVVERMTNMLKDVHLKPDIANHIEVLWMPGPRYSCDSSERLSSFPDEAIRLIETEITRCIQPQYLDLYLKEGWQDSKCLSTVLVTATILFLFQNVKELKISGNATRQMWGAEAFFKMIKRLESHTKPECKILQKLESAGIRWTTTSRTAFEFLEWLAGLLAINSIYADGFSTHFKHPTPRLLAPRSSSLTKIELVGHISGTQTIHGILQAARSLECFINHSSPAYKEYEWVKPNVEGNGVCLLRLKFCSHSLKKLQTNLELSAANLRILPPITHLWAPLRDLPVFERSGEIINTSSLPQSLEHLVLTHAHPGGGNEKNNSFVEVLVHAKDRHSPSLQALTLVYPYFPFLTKSDEMFLDWIEPATKRLAEVGIDFHCVSKSGHDFDHKKWEDWRSTF